jgi:hypothetical protein
MTGMTKILIALATTVALVRPAHAEPDQTFDCSNIGYGITATSEHVSDAQIYNIEITISRRGKTTRPPVVVFDMSKGNIKGTGLKLKVNGRSCKEIKQ